MRKSIPLSLGLLFVNLLTFAQQGAVKGTVTNKNGETLEFVNVFVKDTKYGTTTNEDGEFALKNIPAGKYRLIAQFVGLKTEERAVEVLADKTLEVVFTMTETTQQLAEVKVVGGVSANEKTVSIGKIAIKPMDLPQAVATIDRTVLDRQQVLRLSDVLMNTNGVYIMGATGGYQEEIAGRGFAFNSTNTFKNGVRYFNGTLPETSSLEKVEVIKGSAAILFGNVAAGGILNLVTKKPRFDNGGSLSMRVGSFTFYKPTIDVYGSLLGSKKLAYRLNGTYENSGSYRENVSSERKYINPSLLYKWNDKTEILLEGDYMKDRRTTDFGIGTINYEITPLPRERFIGVNWSYYDIDQTSANLTITHQFSPNWRLSAVVAYRAYTSDLFANMRPNANSQPVRADGTWIRGIQRTGVTENYGLGQIDLTGNFQTGAIAHTLLVGADADQYRTQTTAYTAIARYDTINVFGTKVYQTRSDIPNMSVATITNAPINRVGVYVQDLVNLTEKIKVLAGVRYSYQQTESNVLTVSTNKTTNVITFDDAFTPRLGLVIQPNKNMSLFASYANSFNINTGVDIYNNALPPSFINQTEIGMKNELFNGILSANITAYQIVNSNLAQVSLVDKDGKPQNNSNVRELAGEVTSKGVEVDIKSKPFLGFSLMAGYSYNETRYTKSNIFIVGSLLRYNPNHTANMSVYYTFSEKLKGLNVGLTGMYFGERVAGRSTRLTVANDVFRLIPINAYTQIDVHIGYNFKQFSIRGKISNLLNELSYNVHDDNSVLPIAPRMASLTLMVKW